MRMIDKIWKGAMNRLTAMGKIIFCWVYCNPVIKKIIVDQFHMLYYNSFYEGKTWANTTWLGIKNQKCPFDLWNYQEIIYELKPELIIETGTMHGGSALFLATICDLVGHGEVLTIDIEKRPNYPQHKRITYITGSSTANEVINEVKDRILNKKTVLVILDSDHCKKHVLDELRIYSKFVTKGSYLIVEDSNINGHPVYRDFGPGPMEAINDFLKGNKDFIIDNDRGDKFYLTFNPKGYLKKIN